MSGAHVGGGRGRLPCFNRSPKIEIQKDTEFVDAIMLNVLRDLAFSRNQPLKSADGLYIGILGN